MPRLRTWPKNWACRRQFECARKLVRTTIPFYRSRPRSLPNSRRWPTPLRALGSFRNQSGFRTTYTTDRFLAYEDLLVYFQPWRRPLPWDGGGGTPSGLRLPPPNRDRRRRSELLRRSPPDWTFLRGRLDGCLNTHP